MMAASDDAPHMQGDRRDKTSRDSDSLNEGDDDVAHDVGLLVDAGRFRGPWGQMMKSGC